MSKVAKSLLVVSLALIVVTGLRELVENRRLLAQGSATILPMILK